MEGFICIDIKKNLIQNICLQRFLNKFNWHTWIKFEKKAKQSDCTGKERTPAARRKINVLIDKIRTSYQFIKHRPFVKACPIRDI